MTTERAATRVLWIDDDDPARFVYEESQLRRRGYQVTRVGDVVAAAERLSVETFDVIILDQMLAGPGVAPDLVIWGGCRLLYWLRDPRRPPAFLIGPERAWSRLEHLVPLPENQRLPVAIVSAYHQGEVLRATRSASPQDRAIPFLSKPVDLSELLAFLERARG